MKHKEALCKNGIKYKPEDIKDIKKLVEMRYYGLTDIDRQFELLAVNAKNPYFRFKHSPGKDFSRKENNPAHTKIKDELLNFLKSSKTLRVYTNEFIEDENKEKHKIENSLFFLNEISLENYEWKTEVFKRIDKNGYTLFDICGYSKDIPYPTSAKPNFIFEIIQSSFPKPEVFKHICVDSETNFTICIFIYIPESAIYRKDYNFYWNNFEVENDITNIRVTQYIDNGFFHTNEKRRYHYEYDIIDENGEVERISFDSKREEDEYWKKYYLNIKEAYFKSAVKKLKS